MKLTPRNHRKSSDRKPAALYICLLLTALLVIAACTSETYTPGEGRYSMLRADFAEVRTDASGALFCAITDDGDSLLLSQKRTVKWAVTSDSLYRALLYHNIAASGITTEAVSVVAVPTPTVKYRADVKTPKTDPVIFRSAWMSRGGRYVNLGLAIKTGHEDGEDKLQSIGMMCDEVTTDADGSRHYFLTLLHAQNGVPEYYSANVFVSIAAYRLPVPPKRGDKITISINTYDGTVEKTFLY